MNQDVPTTIDREAPVVARHSLLISAPRSIVWDVHTRVDAWPQWQTDMHDLVPDGPVLRAGGWFTWSTEGLVIRSTVHRVDPQVFETLWGGPANGIVGMHAWSFASQGPESTLVTTEESWSGEPVTANIGAAQKALDNSLIHWLELMSGRAMDIFSGHRSDAQVDHSW